MRYRNAFFLLAVLAFAGAVQAQTTNFNVTNVDMSGYEIDGVFNPALTLTRGRTYTFTVTATAAHPFYIKTVQGVGTANQYNNGVTGQGANSGSILTFVVPLDAPTTLWYQCSNHSVMSNTITLINSPVPALNAWSFSGLALALGLLFALVVNRKRTQA
jgi:hypothetical protein